MLPLITHAQTYHPFSDSLGRWYEQGIIYVMIVIQAMSKKCGADGWVYDQGSDTIINGLKYSLIGEQESWYYSTIGGFVISVAGNDSVIFPGNIIGAIREDSSKKIWYRAFVPY